MPEKKKGRVNTSVNRDVVIKHARALLEAEECDGCLFRNVVLARIGRDNDDEPFIAHHTRDTLGELLSERAIWGHPTSTGDGWRHTSPPRDVVGAILDAPDLLDVPIVEQVVNAPVFSPTGTLHIEPGLLEAARVWYEPADAMKLAWSVPERPSSEHVETALGYFRYLSADFPFVDRASEVHALALAVQPFVRPMIDGPTPLFVVEAPTPRTGKGLLVKTALIPFLGYEVAARPEPRDHEEWRKQAVAFLLSGKPVFFLDNVTARLDSGPLASAVTEGRVASRLLGHSKDVEAPVRCTWIVAGNNPRLSQEIAGRGVPIKLDARVARPQDRTGFREPNLPRWAREHRGQLVWSALTLAQAWIAAGRPGPDARVPPLGGFESWRGVLGGIVSHAGLGEHFLVNVEAFQSEHVDDEDESLCLALGAWWDAHGTDQLTATEVARIGVTMTSGSVPVSVGDMLLGGDSEALTSRGRATAVALRLKKLERRVLCGFRIVGTPHPRGGRRYALEQAS